MGKTSAFAAIGVDLRSQGRSGCFLVSKRFKGLGLVVDLAEIEMVLFQKEKRGKKPTLQSSPAPGHA